MQLVDMQDRLIEAARDWDLDQSRPSYWEMVRDEVPPYLAMMTRLLAQPRTPAVYAFYRMVPRTNGVGDADFLMTHAVKRLREEKALSAEECAVLDALDDFKRWAEACEEEFDRLVDDDCRAAAGIPLTG